jgi:hypothetical protein
MEFDDFRSCNNNGISTPVIRLTDYDVAKPIFEPIKESGSFRLRRRSTHVVFTAKMDIYFC